MKNLSLLIFLLETFDKQPVFCGIHFISDLDLVTVIITLLALLGVMFQIRVVIFGHYRVVVCAVERSFWYSVVCWFITKKKRLSWKILIIADDVYRGFSYRSSDSRERTIKLNPLQRNSCSKKCQGEYHEKLRMIVKHSREKKKKRLKLEELELCTLYCKDSSLLPSRFLHGWYQLVFAWPYMALLKYYQAQWLVLQTVSFVSGGTPLLLPSRERQISQGCCWSSATCQSLFLSCFSIGGGVVGVENLSCSKVLETSGKIHLKFRGFW